MKIRTLLSTLLFAVSSSSFVQATVSQIPGPEDQGGMVMPTVLIVGTTLSYSWQSMGSMDMGDGMGGGMESWNPATDSVLMGTVGYWTDGDHFETGTTYGNVLNPIAEGGQGLQFSSRYGFWLESTSDALPAGNFLAIRLTSISAGVLGWNNPADQVLETVFSSIGDSVLWNGSMWHTLFTLSPDAAAGLYSATFEIFVATATDPTWSGFVDSTTSYTLNSDYNVLSIPYTWQVVPEPSAASLAVLAVLGMLICRRFKKSRRIRPLQA